MRVQRWVSPNEPVKCRNKSSRIGTNSFPPSPPQRMLDLIFQGRQPKLQVRIIIYFLGCWWFMLPSHNPTQFNEGISIKLFPKLNFVRHKDKRNWKEKLSYQCGKPVYQARVGGGCFGYFFTEHKYAVWILEMRIIIKSY